VLVQAFLAQPRIEALDVRVLDRLACSMELQPHAGIIGPLVERSASVPDHCQPESCSTDPAPRASSRRSHAGPCPLDSRVAGSHTSCAFYRVKNAQASRSLTSPLLEGLFAIRALAFREAAPGRASREGNRARRTRSRTRSGSAEASSAPFWPRLRRWYSLALGRIV